jgi:NAD dependent epimerase/dehydratase family enzyme
MKIVIPGGTGQVGSVLARAFHGDGHEVVVLGRSPKPAPWRVARWDPASLAGWAREFDGADAVINLAGHSVNCRYTPRNRAEILQSRVASVGAVGRAIAEARRPPAVWLQASTATIYAHRYDAPNDEASGVKQCRHSAGIVLADQRPARPAPAGAASREAPGTGRPPTRGCSRRR